MNGAQKFHSPDGPAFNKGEQWIGRSGSTYEIISTHRYHKDKWSVDVTYCLVGKPEQTWTRDAWNFQVRCTHSADLVV